MAGIADLHDRLLVRPLEMVGLGSYQRRFGAFTVGGALLLYYLKPSSMFDSNGHMLPWSLTSSDDKPSTPVPFPVAAGLIGVASVLFI